MNFRMVFLTLGRLFVLLAILLLLPLLVSIVYADGQFMSFIYTIIALAAVGIPLCFIKPSNNHVFAREGFVIVAAGWIFMTLFGALPLLFSGEIGNYIDCVFEIGSGFTTTGASIVNNVEILSPSINFWRCFSIWIGGMGVLAFMFAVLPKMDNNSQSMHIFRAEAPGPQVSKISSKLQNTSRVLYAIYIGLTLLETVLLLFGGLNFYESITCSMSNAGTGGFYIYNDSIGHFNSVYVEMVVAVFMTLCGINFNVFYLIFVGRFVQAIKSEELRWYLGILLSVIVVISLSLSLSGTTANYWQSLRYGFFQAAAIMSSTGFASTDFNLWPGIAKTVMTLLMLIGASAGSTGGGMKVARLVLLGKSARRSCLQMLSPNAIVSVKFEGKTVDDDTVKSVQTYFVIYVSVIAFTTLILSLDGFSGVTNLTAAISCLNNIGPGFDAIGPMSNYSGFGVLSKIVLTLVMIAGRLELFPLVMLGFKKTWVQ